MVRVSLPSISTIRPRISGSASSRARRQPLEVQAVQQLLVNAALELLVVAIARVCAASRHRQDGIHPRYLLKYTALCPAEPAEQPAGPLGLGGWFALRICRQHRARSWQTTRPACCGCRAPADARRSARRAPAGSRSGTPARSGRRSRVRLLSVRFRQPSRTGSRRPSPGRLPYRCRSAAAIRLAPRTVDSSWFATTTIVVASSSASSIDGSDRGTSSTTYG